MQLHYTARRIILFAIFFGAASAGTLVFGQTAYRGSTTFTVTAVNSGCSQSTTASFVTTIDGAGNESTAVSYNPDDFIECSAPTPFYRHTILITGYSSYYNGDGSFAGIRFSYTECTEQDVGDGTIQIFCSDFQRPVPYSSVVVEPPAITSFGASVSPICAGQSTTLSWRSSGGASATITDLATGAVTSVAVSGSLPVAPPTTRTYRLTVSNSSGSVTRDATVTVRPLAAINGFSASPPTVNAGQSTTLSLNVSNTTARSITDLTTGAVMNLDAESGTLTVTPATTRTYRLTASNGCNTVTQDITVTVVQPPAITGFSASPSSVCAGVSSTLSWTSSGGTSASITDLTSGAVTPVAINGTLAVTPPSTRTYRLIVSNDAGSVTSDVTITVTSLAAVNSFSASATTINDGQSTTLFFNVSHTTSRTITDLTTGVVTSLDVESGTLTVSPATTRTYRLTASNGCNSVTRDVTITVIQPPAISSFTSNAGSVCAGGATTLSWSASGGTSATISAPGLPGSPVSVNPASGTLVVNPASTTTYTLTVSNSAGSIARQVTVTVTPAPTVVSFTASATTINAGQSTTLSFTSTGGISATITDLTSGIVTSVAVNGSLVVTPATTRTYRFTVTGTCGTATRDVQITVTQPPTISSFTASASTICAGASTTLSWASNGGASATMTDLVSGTVSNVAVTGSLIVIPATTRTYRLTVTNSAGSVTRDLTITVTPLAAINSFTASATTINAGQSTTLSFNVSSSTSRTITDLTSGTVTTLATESGTLVVTPATTRTYRLTATNSCNSVTRDLTITVNQPPTISTFAASASPVCAGSSSTLSWSASGGASATISASGLPGSPVSVNPNSGSLVVNPASTTVYTLTVTNGAGSTTRTVTVTVTPAPAVSTYTASPATITQGQSSTLSWTTTNGTSATITDLTSGAVTSVGVNSSLVVTPATTRQYRLTVTGSCGTAMQPLTVTVTPCQTVSTFTASSSTINAGGSSTLSYTLTGATSATITDLTTGTVTSVTVQSGSLVVTPPTTRTYRLTVNGPCAAITRDLTITVNQPPTISSFTASPSTFCAGTSSTLTWASTGGTSPTITDLTTGMVTSVAVNGSLTVAPPTTRTYRLTVTNGAGSVTREVAVTVNQSPTIVSLTFSPSTANPGQTVTLSWASTGGTSATIFNLTTAQTFPTTLNGTFTFAAPDSTQSIRLAVTNGCGTTTRDATLTITSVTGDVMVGPAGQPDAVGPTDTNDDYTNITLTAGVAVPAGGVTTEGGTINFTNTVRNNASQADDIQLSIQSTASGVTTAQISVDGGSTFAATQTINLASAANRDVIVRVQLASGVAVLSGYDVVLRATSVTLGGSSNDTIDRVWSGFVRAVKTQTVTNSTGAGGSSDPVSGAQIDYVVTYTNVTAASGTGNVNLTATVVVLTEDGGAPPNNWGSTTTHVPGSASDSLGGVITGDTVGSSLLTDTVPSLAPGQTGTFRFRRVIR